MSDVLLYVVRSAADEAESRRRGSASKSNPSARTRYTVLIYSQLPLELGLELPADLEGTAARPLGDLPLIGSAHLDFGRIDYQRYLAAFLQGDKAPAAMRSQLNHALSPQLAAAIRSLSDRAARIWFHTDCPELDELPWELILDFDGGGQEGVCFVRGLPAYARRAIVPLRGKPRLGVIGSAPFAHASLLETLQRLQTVELVTLSGAPRECLQKAIREGFELLHIVADGFITQAYDGALYFHGLPDTMRSELTGAELASHLLASRVAVIGLSTPDERHINNPDCMQLAGRDVPSVYRAYTRLLASEKSLPTVLAPVGPLDEPLSTDVPRLTQFWEAFYNELGAKFSVQSAVARARARVPGSALALYLRHPTAHVFRHADSESLPDISRMAAEHALSVRFTDRIRTLQEELGTTSDAFGAFVSAEDAHQDRIQNELTPWLRDEEAVQERLEPAQPWARDEGAAT